MTDLRTFKFQSMPSGVWHELDGHHYIQFRSGLHTLECVWDNAMRQWLYCMDGNFSRSHIRRPKEDVEGAKRHTLEIFKSCLDAMGEAYKVFEEKTECNEKTQKN